MTFSTAISAAILAGGKAIRFGGRPKGLADVDGRPVVSRQLEVLSSRTEHIALVGDNLELFDGVVGESIARVPDRAPESGPLSGIAAAVHWSPTEWVMVVASDLPFVNGQLIDALCGAITTEVSMVAPSVDGRLQPIAALYHQSVREELDRCVQLKLLSPRKLFENDSSLAARVVELQLPLATALAGFNSADELDELRKHNVGARLP